MGTPVIFRKWPKKEGGDVIALFPTLVGSMDPYTCMSYEQVGQHGGADPQGVIQATESAKPAEYADLLSELKGIGYDDLIVYQRLQYKWLEERKKTLAAMSRPTRKVRRSKPRAVPRNRRQPSATLQGMSKGG